MPASAISAKFGESRYTVGHTLTMSFMPMDSSSSFMALGSGQKSGSKCQSPECGQWK